MPPGSSHASHILHTRFTWTSLTRTPQSLHCPSACVRDKFFAFGLLLSFFCLSFLLSAFSNVVCFLSCIYLLFWMCAWRQLCAPGSVKRRVHQDRQLKPTVMCMALSISSTHCLFCCGFSLFPAYFFLLLFFSFFQAGLPVRELSSPALALSVCGLIVSEKPLHCVFDVAYRHFSASIVL